MKTKSIVLLSSLVLGAYACKTDDKLQELSQAEALDTSPSIQRGERISYTSPNGLTEYCWIPQHFPGADYSKDDKKAEKKLCGLNFHKEKNTPDPGQEVYICPKVYSTNPGLEFHKYDASDINKSRWSKDEYLANFCRKKDTRPTKKIAKYKQSITCSYTGSILSAYHLSRMLGDIAGVPAGVLRTMDLAEHKQYRDVGKNSALSNFWNQYERSLTTRKFQDRLLTTDKKQLFGALSENPSKEFKYYTFNSRNLQRRYPDMVQIKKQLRDYGVSDRWDYINVKPAEKMLARPAFKDYLFSSRAVSQLPDIGTRGDLGLIKKVKIMKDLSDMMILDYILGMVDRPGNIHFKMHYYYKKATSPDEVTKHGAFKIKDTSLRFDGEGNFVDKEKNPFNPDSKFGTGNWVAFPRLLLKDNDCGVQKSSKAWASTAGHNPVRKLAHMSPKTYKKVLWLSQPENHQKMRDFFRNVNAMDTKNKDRGYGEDLIVSNIVELASTLKRKCLDGSLKLDLGSTKSQKKLDEIRNYRHSSNLCE